MKKRIYSILLYFTLAVILVSGVWLALYLTQMPSTSGEYVDVVDLYNNPQDYDLSRPDGIASIIIREDLDKTSSINTVTAVVFDFRGYDTLGESFVLLTAISGSLVILRGAKRHAAKKKEVRDEKEIV